MSDPGPIDSIADTTLAQEVMDEIDAEFAELEAEISRISKLPQVAAPEKVALLDALRAKWRGRLKQRGDQDAQRPRWRRQIDKALENAIEDILEDQAVDIDGNLAFSLENETVQRHAPKVMQALAAGLGEALTKGGVSMARQGEPESGAEQLVRQLLAGFGTAVGKAMAPMAAAGAVSKHKTAKHPGEVTEEESASGEDRKTTDDAAAATDKDAANSSPAVDAPGASRTSMAEPDPRREDEDSEPALSGSARAPSAADAIPDHAESEPEESGEVALVLAHLALTPTDTSTFQGFPPHTGRPRVFGGVLAGQAMLAASRTVQEADRFGHSFHGHFLRPGDPSKPIDYHVASIRDGGSFSTRRVDAHQSGHVLFTATIGFHRPEPGLAHQSPMPSAPLPDALESREEVLARYLDRDPKNLVLRVLAREPQPFDRREVAPVDLLRPTPRHGLKKVWFRAMGTLPDDPHVHRAALTYASDYGLLPNCLETHGLTWLDRRVVSASLDHTVWFHRPFRVDEWLLYVSESPSADGGRGLSMGRIYRGDGMLVASVAQEGLVRITTPRA